MKTDSSFSQCPAVSQGAGISTTSVNRPPDVVTPAGASDQTRLPPVAPTLVTDGDEASVVDNMRRIVPYVLYKLREVLRSNPSLSRQIP